MVLAKVMVQLSIAIPNCMDCTFSIHSLRVQRLHPPPMDRHLHDSQSNKTREKILYKMNLVNKIKTEKFDKSTLSGIECAENRMITSLRMFSGNWLNSFRILSANVLTKNGFVAHRSMTLHLMCFGRALCNANKNIFLI